LANDSTISSAFIRGVAVGQAILAAVAAFFAIAFFPDGRRLGGDGVAEGFRWSFIGAFAVVAVLWTCGARRAWRAKRFW
jgi:hypothetical protein